MKDSVTSVNIHLMGCQAPPRIPEFASTGSAGDDLRQPSEVAVRSAED